MAVLPAGHQNTVRLLQKDFRVTRFGLFMKTPAADELTPRGFGEAPTGHDVPAKPTAIAVPIPLSRLYR